MGSEMCIRDRPRGHAGGVGKKRSAPDANDPMPVATSGTRAYSRPLMISRSASANEPMVDALREPGPVRDAALAELHELRRRPELLARLSRGEVDDLAHQATDDAMTAILAKLDTFRGESRFTTWAYKFVLLEAGVKARRRTWHGREVALEAESWPLIADASPGAHQAVQEIELLHAIRDAVRTELTPHQREVFSALALNGVPIDVLAERLGSTRGALYKTLHDARRRLRAALADAGYDLHDQRHTGVRK